MTGLLEPTTKEAKMPSNGNGHSPGRYTSEYGMASKAADNSKITQYAGIAMALGPLLMQFLQPAADTGNKWALLAIAGVGALLTFLGSWNEKGVSRDYGQIRAYVKGENNGSSGDTAQPQPVAPLPITPPPSGPQQP